MTKTTGTVKNIKYEIDSELLSDLAELGIDGEKEIQKALQDVQKDEDLPKCNNKIGELFRGSKL